MTWFRLVEILGILFFFVFFSCSTGGSTVELKNERDSISYYLGIFTGHILKEANYEFITQEALYDAIKYSHEKGVKISEYQEADSIIEYYVSKGVLNRNLEIGKDYLIKNSKQEGVYSTSSGLQYEILKQGSGPTPDIGDTVTLFLKGTTIEGEIFMNLHDPGPHSMVLRDGTKGGIEALQMMQQGSKYRFVIPTEMGYGLTPPPPGILKPNMPIIYEIELVKIEKGIIHEQ